MDPAEHLVAEFTRRGIEALCAQAHVCTAVVNDLEVGIWFGSDITWQGNDGRGSALGSDRASLGRPTNAMGLAARIESFDMSDTASPAGTH
jgi:hypothetical protein